MGGKRSIIDEAWVVEGAVAKLETEMEESGLIQQPLNEIPQLLKTTKGKDGTQLAIEYGRLWKSMYKFFCYIGDYRSALLVNRMMCPVTPPPLDPISLCAYISFMCDPPGSQVLHATNKSLITDRLDNIVLAKGTWTSPNCVYKLASAIRALHSMYRHLRAEIPYSPSCEECVKLNDESDVSPGNYLACKNCFNAFGRGCTETSGCVLSDPTVSQHLKGTRAKLGETHRVKGNVQLTSGEIRRIRK